MPLVILIGHAAPWSNAGIYLIFLVALSRFGELKRKSGNLTLNVRIANKVPCLGAESDE
jgi:hypothetical protein